MTHAYARKHCGPAQANQIRLGRVSAGPAPAAQHRRGSNCCPAQANQISLGRVSAAPVWVLPGFCCPAQVYAPLCAEALLPSTSFASPPLTHPYARKHCCPAQASQISLGRASAGPIWVLPGSCDPAQALPIGLGRASDGPRWVFPGSCGPAQALPIGLGLSLIHI